MSLILPRRAITLGLLWVGVMVVAGLGAAPTPQDKPAKPKPKPTPASKKPDPGLRVAVPLDEARLPKDKVLVEICEEGVPENETWSPVPLTSKESYQVEAFGFSLIPNRYIETGVRASRSNPFLLRAVARVEIPAGRHRLLLRGRGASRLLINGELVLSTPFILPISDGHTPIPTEALDLGPNFRFVPPGNREEWTPFTSKGGTHLVMLETIVGGKKGAERRRLEPGETVVALALEGSDQFRLLAPERVISYDDEGWDTYAAEEAKAIAKLEGERRAIAFQAHYAPWASKREHARQWLKANPGPKVPEIPKPNAKGEVVPILNEIDRFLAPALAKASQGDTGRSNRTIDFAKQVRPILEARCYSCHQGEKVRGKLRLDQAEGMLKGGASGEPAIVAGEPDGSLLIERITSQDAEEVMPPKGDHLTASEVDLFKRWIAEGGSWEPLHQQEITPLTNDLAFLRRVTLDTVGLVPSEAEIQAFLADSSPDKRARVIDRLLDDPRGADHGMGYWQDVLAENPNILNPTLNNTGPFRWWIHESLLDNKPIDLFVTELIRMQGSLDLGGPAGFGMASQNDVPMAEKAVIVTGAFLGLRMKCARCHDSPAHETTQQDLFEIAALLQEKPITLPKTSSVELGKLGEGGRQPLIKVTLKPGTAVQPAWPFPELASEEGLSASDKASPRSRLAALITQPENTRFAQVIANRVWKRLMGLGLVEPVDDWEKGARIHPDLLEYLGRELVRSEYDLKHLTRLILNSHAYQRASAPEATEPDPNFAAPARGRLAAEQIVDSLFHATGKGMKTEEVNLDVDGRRSMRNSINLGKPRRAWQFASTSNERDRPSLALPRVQAVNDVLEAFGWRPTRQDALTVRETSPNLIQPAVLANGTMGVWLTRLSEDHGITQLALEDQELEKLVDRLFLRILTRLPREDERASVVSYLQAGYAERKVVPTKAKSEGKDDVWAGPRKRPRYVSWSNHLTEEANMIKVERENEARRGDPPTDRLDPTWRLKMEDVLWSLLNSPEFLFSP